VLARTGFRDHAALSHSFGQQRLAQCVVDLVRAGVGQVLSLEEHARTAQRRRQPPRLV
jgi:hypothetical protein